MNERIKLPREALQALKKLAARRGTSLSETMRHAINTEIYMHNRLAEGHTILSQDPRGDVWKVVFTHPIKVSELTDET